MTRPSLDPRRAPLRSSPDPPHARALIDHDRFHYEIVDVDSRLVSLVLFLGIRECRSNQLGERLRESLVRQVEDRQCILYALATDFVGEQPRLTRADPVIPEFCRDFHLSVSSLFDPTRGR